MPALRFACDVEVCLAALSLVLGCSAMHDTMYGFTELKYCTPRASIRVRLQSKCSARYGARRGGTVCRRHAPQGSKYRSRLGSSHMSALRQGGLGGPSYRVHRKFRPTAPAAGSACPAYDLDAARHRALSSSSRSSTARAAPHSMGSPRGVPVPCISRAPKCAGCSCARCKLCIMTCGTGIAYTFGYGEDHPAFP